MSRGNDETRLYSLPERRVSYDATAVLDHLVEARSAAGILNRLPYLQQWISQVHEEQLRLEAAGTSSIAADLVSFHPFKSSRTHCPLTPRFRAAFWTSCMNGVRMEVNPAQENADSAG